MITITTIIDTNEHGKLDMKVHAEGIGTIKEKDLAMAIVELSSSTFDVVTITDGGTPRTTLSPDNRITPIGQG